MRSASASPLRIGGWALLLGAARAAPSPLLGPGARLAVGFVDVPLRDAATAVLDELELKTLVRVLRGEETGLALRASAASGGTGDPAGPPAAGAAPELCCFNASQRPPALRRALSSALLRALGAAAAAKAESVLTWAEVEAVDALAAPLVLPRAEDLPAKVEVGLLQLLPDRSDGYHEAAAAEAAELIRGRGRRVVAGAARFAASLAAKPNCPLQGLVGALPTFVFQGNKAELVLLGPESAELRRDPGANRATDSDEGLGAGVARATELARAVPGGAFAGGVPTFDGASLLLLRRAAAGEERMVLKSQGLGAILKDRRAAFAWARASSWAQGRGALLGVPTFLAPPGPAPQAESESGEAVLEVLVVRRPPAGAAPSSQAEAAEDSPGGPSMGKGLLVMWAGVGCLAFACRRFRLRDAGSLISKAERDLEELVNSL